MSLDETMFLLTNGWNSDEQQKNQKKALKEMCLTLHTRHNLWLVNDLLVTIKIVQFLYVNTKNL